MNVKGDTVSPLTTS